MYSASVMACQPITQPRGAIHIVYSSAPMFSDRNHHTFRTVMDAKMRAQCLSSFWKAMGIQTMVFMVESMATAKAMYDNCAPAFEAVGGKVLGRENFETHTVDFYTLLTRLKT